MLNDRPDIPITLPFVSINTLYASKHSSIAQGYGSNHRRINQNQRSKKKERKEGCTHIREPFHNQPPEQVSPSSNTTSSTSPHDVQATYSQTHLQVNPRSIHSSKPIPFQNVQRITWLEWDVNVWRMPVVVRGYCVRQEGLDDRKRLEPGPGHV